MAVHMPMHHAAPAAACDVAVRRLAIEEAVKSLVSIQDAGSNLRQVLLLKFFQMARGWRYHGHRFGDDDGAPFDASAFGVSTPLGIKGAYRLVGSDGEPSTPRPVSALATRTDDAFRLVIVRFGEHEYDARARTLNGAPLDTLDAGADVDLCLLRDALARHVPPRSPVVPRAADRMPDYSMFV